MRFARWRHLPIGSSLVALVFMASACARQSTTHLQGEGALGPYSGSVAADGFIFVSGKIGSPENRNRSFAAEVNSAIDAVETELAQSGRTLADVVQATVFLRDLEEYDEFNSVYAMRFPPPYPARACVEVSRLPGNARVEIMVIAR